MIFLSGTVLSVRNILQKETHNKVAAIFLSSLQMEMLKLGWLLALDLKYKGLAKFTDDW